MDRLWTPWRMGYVTRSGSSGDIFVDALDHDDDPDSLILHKGKHGFIIMNLYPYNSGHMMVVPNRKVATTEELSPKARAELFEMVNLAIEAARLVLRCDGFNVGLNIGQIAGAGIFDHLHFHVVPRWSGDANFMPITADTMVLPELIYATHARLKAEIATLLARKRRKRNLHLHAGAVTFLEDSHQIVLRRSRDGSIVLPKGHLEKGESAAEAAIRELHEETGYRITLLGWAGIDEFQVKKTRAHVAYFVATGQPTTEVPDHLKTDTLLVPVQDAAHIVTFDGMQEIIHAAIALHEHIGPAKSRS